ncbi:ras GTPase-activating protein 3-like [Ptychodera flava]|uniref:ras GTPase-activating protein 3-like n=1 Tax=Ptychodera flava TaxID=63121 RepID=UPI003969CF67
MRYRSKVIPWPGPRMADSESDRVNVRILESLRIKIGEVKNLGGPNGSCKDTFCCVKLDQEEIYRTAVQEKTSNPFYAEECEFDVPRRFRTLGFYICDKDRMKRSDAVIGKTSIRRDELHQYHGHDHWLSLKPVDADSEVQGKVHIEIRYNELLSESGTSLNKVTVRVLEGSDLTIVNGQCDPYAVVTYTSPVKTETKKTKVRRRTVNPHFDETFSFELQRPNSSSVEKTSFQPNCTEDISKIEIKVSLWNAQNASILSSGKYNDVFIGEVKVLLSDIDVSNGNHKAWYFLRPRETPAKSPKAELGSLRVLIQYNEDHVFPSPSYKDLKQILLKSPQVQPITSSAAYLLGEIHKDKQSTAKSLVKLFYNHGSIVDLLGALADHEISKTSNSNTLFRGNTLTTKCIDEYMKLEGNHYLQDTLKKVIDEIYEEHLPCEIDPLKLRDGENLQHNLSNLQNYVDKVYQCIIDSAMACPTKICEVFYGLKRTARQYFPDDIEANYASVSAFIFLRFFVPAILNPKLFQLRPDNADEVTGRTLTLISKAIQTLANTTLPSKTSCHGMKEEYMSEMYSKLLDTEHIGNIKMFLDIISSSSRAMIKTQETPIVLKEGEMIKRAQGRRKFGLKNFKKRWFVLTTRELTYSKEKDGEPLCHIPVEDILAVERLQEESFKMKHMFQIVQPERALYIQSSNSVEEKQWLDLLTKIVKSNNRRLDSYHPAAYLHGHWICCKAVSENSEGCTPVTGGLAAGIKIDIDVDRELERIHSIFFMHLETLEKLIDLPKDDSDSETIVINGCTIVLDDINAAVETLKSLRDVIVCLEQEHKQYFKQVQKDTKYGSEQSPIEPKSTFEALQ